MYRIFSRALRGNAHERLKDPKYFPPFVSSLLYRLFFEGKTLHENEKIFDFFEIFFKNSAFSCFFGRTAKNGARGRTGRGRFFALSVRAEITRGRRICVSASTGGTVRHRRKIMTQAVRSQTQRGAAHYNAARGSECFRKIAEMSAA